MAKKPDLTKVKTFLFQYGEKVALGACLAVALLVLVMGLIGAAGSGSENGKPWEKALRDAANNLQGRIASAQTTEMPPEVKAQLDPALYDWKPVESNFHPSQLVALPERPDTFRRNPQILPLDAKQIQVSLVRSGAFYYDVAKGRQIWTIKGGTGGAMPGGSTPPGLTPPIAPPGGGFTPSSGMPGATGGGPQLVKAMRPERVVLVRALFPMKKQIEEYKIAFRLKSQGELFSTHKDSLPHPLGLLVWRYEVLPGGKAGPNVQIYGFDAKSGRTTIAPHVDGLLREAYYDETEINVYRHQLHPGLATPLLRLANGKYPKVELPGITAETDVAAADPEKKFPGGMTPPIVPPGAMKPPKGLPGVPTGGLPGVGGKDPRTPEGGEGGEDGRQLERKSWKSLGGTHKALIARLEGNYDPFHPLGHLPAPSDDKEKKAGLPGTTFPPSMPTMPGMPGAATPGADSFTSPFEHGLGGGATMPGGAFPGGGVPPTGIPPGTTPPTGSTPPTIKPPVVPGGGAGAAVDGEWQYDALARFVDTNVEPGKTYKYYVVVRMANPNYNRKAGDVAYQALTEVKELYSAGVWTPEISIPSEYAYYAVDQLQLDKSPTPLRGKDLPKADQTAVQVHRWFPYSQGQIGEPIGDWAIAERVLVRRGQYLAPKRRVVEVPVWNKLYDRFVIEKTSEEDGRKKPIEKKGTALNFRPVGVNPLLVDFDGGKGRTTIGNLAPILDEAAVEALILSPEGKLEVRNARRDAADEQRREHVQHARDRVHEVQSGGHDGGAHPGMPFPPGGGPGGVPKTPATRPPGGLPGVR